MLNTYTGSFSNLMLRSDWMSVTLTLIHEISHRLSAPDHYCELDKDGNCEHAQYCETDFHEHESKASRYCECIMDNIEEVFDEERKQIAHNSRYWENLSNRVYGYVYCIDCENDIREYLWG